MCFKEGISRKERKSTFYSKWKRCCWLSDLKLCLSFNSSTFCLYSTAYLRLLTGKFLYDMKTIVDSVELPIYLTLSLYINAVLGRDLNILALEDKLSNRSPQ